MKKKINRRPRAADETDLEIINRMRAEIRSHLPAIKDVLLKRALEEGDKECLKIVIGICGLLPPDRGPASGADDPCGVGSLSDDELSERIRRLRKLNAETSNAE